jgi:predicted 3-demethylubiquinone-9 3-methyltransferase (glyoxalase superfamily)
MPIKQRITPCLWFDGQAEEAANFYVSVFENSRITAVSRYGDAGPGPKLDIAKLKQAYDS